MKPGLNLVVTTEALLRELVREAVEQAVKAESAPELLSAEETANHLGVSADTVRKWVSRDGCPCVRAGRKLRFRKDEVVAWLEDRRA